MTIRTMNIEDFQNIYDLWIHTEGMGLNTTDDSRDGITKYLLRNYNTYFTYLHFFSRILTNPYSMRFVRVCGSSTSSQTATFSYVSTPSKVVNEVVKREGDSSL